MTFGEFEGIIKDAVEGLPEEFKGILSKNHIELIAREDVPGPLAEKHKGSTVFGVFIGVPMGRFAVFQAEPTRIELYKKSFELFFADRALMEKQIARTVVHEIAHYFGFPEAAIRRLGY